MDADELAAGVDLLLVDGAVGKHALGIALHIILVLELRDGRDEHHIGLRTVQQRSDGTTLEHKVALEEQEIIAADDLATVIKRVHAVGLGVARAEAADNLRESCGQLFVGFAQIARANDDTFDAAVNQRLDGAYHHRLSTSLDEALGPFLSHAAEACSHAGSHYYSSLNHIQFTCLP